MTATEWQLGGAKGRVTFVLEPKPTAQCEWMAERVLGSTVTLGAGRPRSPEGSEGL